MKCPMLMMYAVTVQKPFEYEDRNCLKEKCAWWGCYRSRDGKEIGCCSISAIPLVLSDILHEMEVR